MPVNTKVLFVPNPETLEEISTLPGAADAVKSAASAASKVAAGISPTGRTKRYASSHIVGEPAIGDDGVLACGYGSTDFAAHLVEFGSVNNPPYRTLTRAAEAVGLTFEPSDRP